MPRPRRGEDRRRNVRACIPCQTAKRRCSMPLPCPSCIKRGRVSACIYSDDDGNQGSDQIQPIEQRPAEVASSQLLQQDSPGIPTPRPSVGDTNDAGLLRNWTEGSSIPAESPETSILIQPQLLKLQRGSEVYIGRTAVIAFLPLLRDIFRHHIGPSKFTEYTKGGTMLEEELNSSSSAHLQDDIEMTQKNELVRVFFAATSGILDLFDVSDIIKDQESAYSNDIEGRNHNGSTSLVIAIGARCHPDPQTYLNCERIHLNKSRQLTSYLLENVNMDTVQVFLLMAFYMLCASRRNTAYMYLGVAARAAHAMGLHHGESFDSLTAHENHKRLRTWKSLCVIDSLVSSFLGRPSATPTQRNGLTNVYGGSEDGGYMGSATLEAAYQLVKIVDEGVDDMYRHSVAYAASANALLEKLKSWSINLPPNLRSAPSQPGAGRLDQERVIGNIHVACSYYFRVIMITRPFLVQQLLHGSAKEVERQTGISDSISTSGSVPHAPGISELAQTCEDAAQFMLESCDEILQAGFILSNMCLLQAWIFAAALIIGLIMFLKEEANNELRRSFDVARAVLRKLSIRSQQSERYFEILSDLIDEVDRHKLRVATRKRESSSRLVSRIFRLGHSTEDAPPGNSTHLNSMDGNSYRHENGAPGLASIAPTSAPAIPWSSYNTGDPFYSWDNIMFQSWDDVIPLTNFNYQ